MSPLRVAYKDDNALGGPSATVADDITMIKKEGAPRGLFLNDTKCEAISITGHSTDDALQQFVQLTPLSLVLLGAPLFKGAAIDNCLTKPCADLERAVSRFEAI